MKFATNVAYIQPRGHMLCLHVGSWVVLFGPNRDHATVRLELFTPFHRFRLSGPWMRKWV
jgi:hypothetical protein